MQNPPHGQIMQNKNGLISGTFFFGLTSPVIQKPFHTKIVSHLCRSTRHVVCACHVYKHLGHDVDPCVALSFLRKSRRVPCVCPYFTSSLDHFLLLCFFGGG